MNQEKIFSKIFLEKKLEMKNSISIVMSSQSLSEPKIIKQQELADTNAQLQPKR